MAGEESAALSGRSCDGCTMCCKLLGVEELQKPRQQWCTQCEIGAGCKIYAERPAGCVNFFCGWLTNAALHDEWKPRDCKIVVQYETQANRIAVHVDSARREAWKSEPYYSQIKRWSAAALLQRAQVIVWQGLDAIAIMPDRDILLGHVRSDQFIITLPRRTASGMDYDVEVMERDDPRIAHLV